MGATGPADMVNGHSSRRVPPTMTKHLAHQECISSVAVSRAGEAAAAHSFVFAHKTARPKKRNRDTGS